LFVVMPEATERKLLAEGYKFYRWRDASMPPAERPVGSEVLCRFVCSYQTEDSAIDGFLAAAGRLAA
jgi:threonine aldolase